MAAAAPNGDGTSIVEAASDPRPTSTGGDTSTGIENSQTGSVGQTPEPECQVDLDCAVAPDLSTTWRVELMDAACSHTVNQGTHPTCECRLRRTPEAPDAGASSGSEAFEYTRFPGNRADGCSETSYSGLCLYCGGEFPGCNVDDADSCDAVCAEMARRDANDAQHEFDVGFRLARCNDDHTCSVVSTIDGQCYLGPFGGWLPERVDCNLSDAELLGRLAPPLLGKHECLPRPELPCSTSSDCPRGLSCVDSVCGPCGRVCGTVDSGGVCQGGGACADGEVCVEDTCVLEANASECDWFGGCPENQVCSVSGVSDVGRGNENTRSFCRQP